jgi:hypothetical protein
MDLSNIGRVEYMSKPKWASRHGKWGPVKPDFWRIWNDNKESLKKNGYDVRKNPNGQWEVRYLPPDKRGWPPFKPDPLFVPAGMKASVCLRCGHARLIKAGDEHKDCTMCGAKLDWQPSPDEGAAVKR